MTTNNPKTALLVHLNQVTDWLNNPTLDAAWTAPQGEKWTIEQEFDHLLRATYGIDDSTANPLVPTGAPLTALHVPTTT